MSIVTETTFYGFYITKCTLSNCIEHGFPLTPIICCNFLDISMRITLTTSSHEEKLQTSQDNFESHLFVCLLDTGDLVEQHAWN